MRPTVVLKGNFLADLMPDCTVEDFLNALHVRFGLVYNVSSVKLQDKSMSGTLSTISRINLNVAVFVSEETL